jgi:hypothetical protein
VFLTLVGHDLRQWSQADLRRFFRRLVNFTLDQVGDIFGRLGKCFFHCCSVALIDGL